MAPQEAYMHHADNSGNKEEFKRITFTKGCIHQLKSNKIKVTSKIAFLTRKFYSMPTRISSNLKNPTSGAKF